MSRIFGLFAMLGLLAALLGGCSQPKPPLTVTVLDVGKADAILIEVEGAVALIDTGTAESVPVLQASLAEKNITALDLVVLTHMDKDHIGGMPWLLETVTVRELVQADQVRDSDAHDDYRDALARSGVQPLSLREEQSRTLAGATLILTPGRQESYAQSNDHSLFADLRYGGSRFLFAGDAERERLDEFLTEPALTYDFLKVPHHGKAEKNSALFFDRVSPQYAVITCSPEEPPEDAVLSLLREEGAEVFLTTDGSVVAVTDGVTMQVTQE